MENEGGKIDKWTISIWWQEILIWTNVIFKIFFCIYIFFGDNPTGPSYVDVRQNWYNKDDLTMLCEQMEDDLIWKMTFDGKQPTMEDDLR